MGTYAELPYTIALEHTNDSLAICREQGIYSQSTSFSPYSVRLQFSKEEFDAAMAEGKIFRDESGELKVVNWLDSEESLTSINSKGGRCNGDDAGCCTPSKPCDVGEGHCLNNDDCMDGLFCQLCEGKSGHLWDEGDKCCIEKPAVGTSLGVVQTDLIHSNWGDLENYVTFRYFPATNSANYQASVEDIWNTMGVDINCTVDQDLTVTVTPPSVYNPAKPIKLVTHGFTDTVQGDKVEFVKAWMGLADQPYAVILLDWQHLAAVNQGWHQWDDYVYNAAARNAIDVGTFTGLCLAELSNSHGMPAVNIHLLGHSLGGHVVGKAGMTYQAAHSNGAKIGRITGLDPAGPRYVDGPIMSAIPEIHERRISHESAAFVDIIHSNGAILPVFFTPTMRVHLGDLHQLGHRDFYPDGGSAQTGCFWGQDAGLKHICSHSRAPQYYLHSIRESTLFPSQKCASVDECNNEVADNLDTVYMGERAMEGWDESSSGRQMFYHDVGDCHWSWLEHSNSCCFWTPWC